MESSPEKFCQVCIDGEVSKVTTLLEANPKLANSWGMVRPDHREFMKKLGADAGWSALHLAAHYGQEEIVKILLKAGAEPNVLAKNAEGNTPLMAAIAGGKTSIVSLLLENGADPMKFDASGSHNAIKLAELEEKTEIIGVISGFMKKKE